jgi:two-component system response regulator FixJ
MNRTIVHIIDDEEPVRRALTMLAEAAGHLVLAHPSAESFLDSVSYESAGCVVTDVRMPGMGGIELLRAISQRTRSLPVIVITGHGDVPMAVNALKAGAADFIEKPFDGPVFLAAVSAALRTREDSLREEKRLQEVRERRERLTDRELQVMELIVQGLSNNTAAEVLGISVRTVENHRARVMEKMQAARLSDLVRLALDMERAEA